MHTIDSLKAHLHTQDAPGLALDIDDTLCVTGRIWYDELKRVAGDPGLTFEEMWKQYSGRFQQAPAWKDHPAVATWIHEMINSHDHYAALIPWEKAKERVWDVNGIVPIRAYVTMRSLSVLDATQAWLDAHGFPKAPILSRPIDIPNLEMHAWKARALEELYPHLVGIVDDDPHVIRQLKPGYQGTVFLFGEAERPREDINVVCCKNWDEVYARVQELDQS
jgi:hypothetical protein